MSNDIWTPNSLDVVVNGDTIYDSTTRIEQKRSHEGLMDSSENELFFKKKQAIESVKTTQEAAIINDTLGCNGSSSQSGAQIGDRLFSPKPVRYVNVSERNVSPLVSADISIGAESSKKIGNMMLSNQLYDGINNNFLAIGPYLNQGSYNINTTTDQYAKENGSILSIGPTYASGPDSLFAMDPFYTKMNETCMFYGSSYNKRPSCMMPMASFQGQQNAAIVPLGNMYNTKNSSMLSMVQNSKKGEHTAISFGGFLEGSDPSGTIMTSYNNFSNQPFVQHSEATGLKDAVQQLNEKAVIVGTSVTHKNKEQLNEKAVIVGTSVTHKNKKQLNEKAVIVGTSKTNGTNKNKDLKGNKKPPSNSFPSNVKSLLSTGILDGVPVKYVSWSREKNLRGVIKGTGYLCSCDECKLSKVINAYEFELHAGCKTKHPNNHIYFENGKTIYAVVQELKNTPQDLLFDVVQSVTGSPINQKNFLIWKESFQKATREIQRICGNGMEEVVMPSA